MPSAQVHNSVSTNHASNSRVEYSSGQEFPAYIGHKFLQSYEQYGDNEITRIINDAQAIFNQGQSADPKIIQTTVDTLNKARGNIGAALGHEPVMILHLMALLFHQLGSLNPEIKRSSTVMVTKGSFCCTHVESKTIEVVDTAAMEQAKIQSMTNSLGLLDLAFDTAAYKCKGTFSPEVLANLALSAAIVHNYFNNESRTRAYVAIATEADPYNVDARGAKEMLGKQTNNTTVNMSSHTAVQSNVTAIAKSSSSSSATVR